jgi:hypothetical protein
MAGPDRMQSLRHGDGLHHFANPEQLSADFAKMNKPDRSRARRWGNQIDDYLERV